MVRKLAIAACVLFFCVWGVVKMMVETGGALSPAHEESALAGELRRHVEQLCAAPRRGATLSQAQEYIEHELAMAGFEVRRQEFHNAQGVFYNIIAERKGRVPSRYIIGAHYDACDCGDEEPNPGADDNASGVATLLALAKRLPRTPEYTVELVFYACEEPPWFATPDMGSARHAATCTAKEVKGMICLEMLGCFRHDGAEGASYFPGSRLLLPRTDDFIAVVGDWASLSLAKKAYRHLSKAMPAVRANIPFAHGSILYFSDHRNYAPLGIPAIMITDTAMLRNANYHTTADTPDSLCYPCMASLTAALSSFIHDLTQERQ